MITEKEVKCKCGKVLTIYHYEDGWNFCEHMCGLDMTWHSRWYAGTLSEAVKSWNKEQKND